MYSNLNSVKGLYSWSGADAFFHSKKLPRRWSENQRPLDVPSKPHYALQKDSDGAYSLFLYNSRMVKYHEPAKDRSFVVDLFMPTSHRLNWRFLDNAGWWHGQPLYTLDNRTVRLPLLRSREFERQCAHLQFVYDQNTNALDTERSWVMQFYRRSADKEVVEENRRRRAVAQEKMEALALVLHAGLTQHEPERVELGSGLDMYRNGDAPDVPKFFLTHIAAGNDPDVYNHVWPRLMHAAGQFANIYYTKQGVMPSKDVLQDWLAKYVYSPLTGNGRIPLPMWSGDKLPRRMSWFYTRAEAQEALDIRAARK